MLYKHCFDNIDNMLLKIISILHILQEKLLLFHTLLIIPREFALIGHGCCSCCTY